MPDLPMPEAAYLPDAAGVLIPTELTRGPWDPGHQHAGPPSAMIVRAVEEAGRGLGLTHLARLTVNLIRPIPMAAMVVEVDTDYAGRSAAHFGVRLLVEGKLCARATALMLREVPLPVPQGTPGHPLPQAPRAWEESISVGMPFVRPGIVGYGHLVENRTADGRIFQGPCTAWFRVLHPLVHGETASPVQRLLVAADSGNGVSAALDFRHFTYLNSDLTVNLLRQPQGEWLCLDARTALGGNGCGLAESSLYDEQGLVGRATQSLIVRERAA